MRPFLIPLVTLAALSGCEGDLNAGYCDDTGCYGCDDVIRSHCWPLAHNPCFESKECNANQACTNLGCTDRCHIDADCRPGEWCTPDALCAPKGVDTKPVDPSTQPQVKPTEGPTCGGSQKICTQDSECGSGRACSGGACHARCTSSCPIGQGCISGICLDQAGSQCLWDSDCGPASRCINAICHPLCASDAQCAVAEFCDSGVCRADDRTH